MRKKYVYDIETYPDAFVFVAKEYGSNKRDAWKIYSITDFGFDETSNLKRFIKKDKISLIGYNNYTFDAQVVEKIIRGELTTAGEIYKFAQELIDSDDFPPYRWEDLSAYNLDLYVIGSYNTPARQTSLKWLEFSTRQKQIADLPFDYDVDIKTEVKLKKVIAYCKKDVKATERVAELHEDAIEMRRGLFRKYGKKVFNKSDSQIGEEIMLQEYENHTGISRYDLKKKIVDYDEICVGDVILPTIKFENPIFQEILDEFKNIVLPKDEKTGMITIKEAYKKTIQFESCEVDYGLGGLHGCIPPTVVRSSEDMFIATADVASMYPNIPIGNRFYPAHLGEAFCDIYEGIYQERKKHAKGTALNLAYKLCLNSIYGKSNSKWSALRDPMYTLKTTVNGQLMLTMLAEQLSSIGSPIMLNTDGVEFLIPRKYETEYERICKEWEELTNVELEHDRYEFMAIRDVNNYISRTESGKVKRKGAYMTWEDYQGDWHKAPNFTVIASMASNYFETGVAPEITMQDYTNIYDYMAGFKGKKNFYILEFVPTQTGGIEMIKHTERAIRYYASKEGGALYKFYPDKDNDFHAVPGTSDARMKVLQNVKNDHTDNYPDLDRQYYLDEAYKLINAIQPI